METTLPLPKGLSNPTRNSRKPQETLVHPIEVNVDDIQEILSGIEGVIIGPYEPPPNPPQLLMLDFKIDRKGISEKNEVYGLNLKLLKREFL